MIKIEHGDLITRFIGRIGYTGPRTETFHEVLIKLLTSILADPWYSDQLAKKPEDRHIILQWIGALSDETQRAAFRRTIKPERDTKRNAPVRFRSCSHSPMTSTACSRLIG